MGLQDPLWFARLAAVPGISYATPAELDVTKLRRRNASPEISRYPDLPPTLWWGDTTESPASAHVLADSRKATTARVLRNLAEVLELPGEPADYHFAIQGVVSQMRSRGGEGPHVFAELERLCWLDLQLIQACPEVVIYDHPEDGQQYAHVTAFKTLLDLYLTEGALGDAARVLPIAERFRQGDTPATEKARTRMAALAAEDSTR
ncbi:hypothetical protein [Blastococcus mobilis]|uniref:Uncharacterized protein n=1 Tax=Blastococcus mobilis TaxID=1938746 RepID=A0A238ZSQ6_9ACTN|nr:hypothetical protein [Blastococcus mobilis]SNR86041.1 hypothetical protein SAMN06272737_13223 [Blastococcus mobilis]